MKKFCGKSRGPGVGGGRKDIKDEEQEVYGILAYDMHTRLSENCIQVK